MEEVAELLGAQVVSSFSPEGDYGAYLHVLMSPSSELFMMVDQQKSILETLTGALARKCARHYRGKHVAQIQLHTCIPFYLKYYS